MKRKNGSEPISLEVAPVVSLEVAPVVELPPARGSWIPRTLTPVIGIDPAVWSQRKQQVALWRLIESWNRGRRLH